MLCAPPPLLIPATQRRLWPILTGCNRFSSGVPPQRSAIPAGTRQGSPPAHKKSHNARIRVNSVDMPAQRPLQPEAQGAGGLSRSTFPLIDGGAPSDQ